jgi:hypothetical protein
MELIDFQGRKAVMGHGGKKNWEEGAGAHGIYETGLGKLVCRNIFALLDELWSDM